MQRHRPPHHSFKKMMLHLTRMSKLTCVSLIRQQVAANKEKASYGMCTAANAAFRGLADPRCQPPSASLRRAKAPPKDTREGPS